MYHWLRNYLPGKPRHTPDRWKKMNDAFGEGWEADLGNGEKWDKRLAQVKAWVDQHGYPRQNNTSAETSMYVWLRTHLPGKPSHTPARWRKLNDALGEGWEADFGMGAHESRLEAKWDARLVQVKAWVVQHGRYPGSSSRKRSAERSMNNWLYHNLPGKLNHTPDRWKKLNDAFGEGWEADYGAETRKGQLERKWSARLAQIKAWVDQHGYPRNASTPKETAMYIWFRTHQPGGQSHTTARWKKINDAFGEGWEADFNEAHKSHVEAKWDARLAQVKAWVVEHREYPRKGKKTSAETSMNNWLRAYLPGKTRHTTDRWKKMNDAFGEGWEADFGEGAHESQLEAKWDARLVQVKAWVVQYGRYPSSSRKKTPAERSMNNWLRTYLPGKTRHTTDRWKKMNDAFGEGWEADFTSQRVPRFIY
jgi:hypothetical protein